MTPEENEKILYERLSAFLKLYGKKLEKLLNSVDKDIARLFAKYGKDNSMTYLDALKYLTDNERAEFQEDLEFYLEKIEDEEYVKNNRAYLQALSVRARVRRLEYIKGDITAKATEFFQDLEKEARKELSAEASEAFIRKVEEIVSDIPTPGHKIVLSTEKTPVEKTVEKTKIDTPEVVGVAEKSGATITVNGEKLDLSPESLENWGKVNSDLMEEILEYPWSGENFSQKIWGECDNLTDVLNKELIHGLVTGKPYDQIISEMEKKLNVARWKIERLVRTEASFITNQAQLSAYYKSGIKEYEYLARLDERTSPQCKGLNGKKFKVKEAQAGVNYPPMHPYCRSTTKAVIDYSKVKK